MSVASGEIGRVLDEARGRRVRIVVLAALGFGLAAALLCLFLGAVALALGARPGIRGLALAGGTVSVLAALAWAVQRLVRTAWSAEATARALAAGDPLLRSDLVSAVELARARGAIAAAGHFSLALVDAHLDGTAARAGGVSLDRAIPDRWARYAGLALLGVGVVHGVGFVAGGGGLLDAYGKVLAGEPGAKLAAAADPITGDVEVTYRYPAYMRREPKTLSGTGGEVRAPPGTEVTLRTRADRDVRAAEIEVEVSGMPARPAAAEPSGTETSALPVRPSTGSGRTDMGRPGHLELVEGSDAGRAGGAGADGPGAGTGGSGAGTGGSKGTGSGSAQPGKRAWPGPLRPEPVEGRTDGVATAPAQPKKRAWPGSVRPEPVEGRTEPGAPRTSRHPLTVSGARDLEGRFTVEGTGSYRFRFLDGRGKAVAAGPPLPIVLEPDLPPTVRISAPEREVEVDPGEGVRIDWSAEDDHGLAEIALVVKGPDGEERRRVLRESRSARRESGVHDLDLGPERLEEGERLLYWLEATDEDSVSGPKKGVSQTQVVKIWSEAEHRRKALEEARLVFEEMVTLLADRLEALDPGPVDTPDRLVVAQQLDVRTRRLHERMREVARSIRRDRAGPRDVARALENVAGLLRVIEQRLAAARAPVAQAFRIRATPDRSLVGTMTIVDARMTDELEKGILYLEQLLDKQRADDLLLMAKDLAAKRRELADLLEKFKASPTEAAKKELLAKIARMKERVKELLARMAETSRGFADEHMNREALAEMARSQDVVGGLDDVERMLAKGDVEGAMRALDEMASSMDRMLAGLDRTSRLPDEKARELMKEMLAFKAEIEKVKAEQEKAARETDAIRQKYRKAVQERLRDAEEKVKRLEQLAREAREDVEAAQPGITFRAEPEHESARESLAALERALGTKELGAALESSLRAAPAVERLARFLEEDVALAEQNAAYTRREPEKVRGALEKAIRAVPKAREVRQELSRLLPEPRQVLSPGDQRRLDQLSRQQLDLEREAAGLQRKLQDLMQKAPVFPQEAPGQLGESRGHMNQAAGELAQKNPQRGHGQQELALDALSRFQKGLEEAAKRGRGQGGGMGFPFPFGDAGGGEEGEGRDPSREKVNIPGAEAHKVPEEFRRDLLEAMKQGSPERYRAEVQRYYEELVK